MDKVKSISEVIELMEKGYSSKEDFLFQNDLYKLNQYFDGKNVKGTMPYMIFINEKKSSNINFFFHYSGKLLRIFFFQQINGTKFNDLFYHHEWTYEKKRETYYHWGIM